MKDDVKRKLMLLDEDLQGVALGEVRCKQCSCFCSERQPVFVEDVPTSLCTRNERGREVVLRWKKRVNRQ